MVSHHSKHVHLTLNKTVLKSLNTNRISIRNKQIGFLKGTGFLPIST